MQRAIVAEGQAQFFAWRPPDAVLPGRETPWALCAGSAIMGHPRKETLSVQLESSLKQQDGWLADIQRCPSPNHNARPDPSDISLLVIHNISLPPGQFGTDCVSDFFCNALDCDAHPYFDQLRDLRVSAHFLIERDGRLVQFVPLQQRAWHAGASCFDGREDCNDFSIGIELEGTDEEAYTDQQYSQLAVLSRQLMNAYPALNAERICGHSDIAPGRKTDPGPSFDWARYRTLLKE